MVFDLDKYTSWCNPYIDVILDSDFIWVQVELDLCTIANEVLMNYYIPIHLLELVMIIVDDCSWNNNLCIIAVDKWSIEIYIVQKTIPLIGRCMKMIIWSKYLNYGPYSKLLKRVNNSWVDIAFIKVYWYSPCKRKSPYMCLMKLYSFQLPY